MMRLAPAIRPNVACWLTLGGAAASLAAMWIALQVEDGALPPRLFFAGLALLHVALLIDGLDGYVARRFSLQSDLGKHLDGFADAITFLVAPVVFLRVLGLRDGAGSLALGALVLGGILRLATFGIIGNHRAGERWQYTGIPAFYSHFLLAFLCALRRLVDLGWFVTLAAVLVTGLALSFNTSIPTPKPTRLGTIVAVSGAMILGALVACLLEVRPW